MVSTVSEQRLSTPHCSSLRPGHEAEGQVLAWETQARAANRNFRAKSRALQTPGLGHEGQDLHSARKQLLQDCKGALSVDGGFSTILSLTSIGGESNSEHAAPPKGRPESQEMAVSQQVDVCSKLGCGACRRPSARATVKPQQLSKSTTSTSCNTFHTDGPSSQPPCGQKEILHGARIVATPERYHKAGSCPSPCRFETPAAFHLPLP